MPPRRTRMSALLCALACAVSNAGCSKSTAPKVEAVNDVKPNGNVRIISQGTFGLSSWISFLRRADDGSFAFYGRYNDQEGAGVLNAAGTLRWFQGVSYEPRFVTPLPASAVVPHGLILTGRRDTNGDGQFDEGYATLFSSAGSPLSEVTPVSDTSAIWFNAFTAVDDSSFIVCGVERRVGVEHPLLAVLHLSAPGVLTIGPMLVAQSQVGGFGGIIVSASSPAELTFAATWRNGDKRGLSRFRVPWPGFESIAVDWSHEIVPPFGPFTSISLTMEQSADNLYVAGIFDDSRKPANQSGIAASYTTAGDLRWTAVVSLTGHSEGFYSIHVGADAAYAVGSAGEYGVAGETNQSLGYGLISKLNLDDGHAIANFTIGSDQYRSVLFTAFPTVGGLICAGRTNQEYTFHTASNAWFATVNVDTTDVLAMSAAPVRRIAGADRGHPEPRLGRRDRHAGGE